MTDVAREAGVALGTVSNVLNHPDKVSDATRQRVMRVIEDLGFVRNSNARHLAAGQSRNVGLVVIDIGNSMFVDIARGAQKAAMEVAMNVMMANSDNSFEQQDRHLGFFDEARVAGILLAPMADSSESIDRVRRHGRPVVVLNYKSPREDICTVLVDNEQVGYLAARHLIQLGRTRLAFVGGRDHLQPVKYRRAGVRRAVEEERGRVTLEEIPTEDLNPTGGTAAGELIVSRGCETRVDGVIAVTDLLGMAMNQVFSGAGLAVPEDIAVVGCDHNSAAWGGTIPLTSVQMRGLDLGAIGLQLLMEELAAGSEPHTHRTVTLQPSLVPRESTIGRAGALHAPR